MSSPAPTRVARRAVILYALIMRYTLEINPHHPRAKDWLVILPRWLDKLKTKSEMEPWDTEILAAPLGELSEDQQMNAYWSGEQAGVLGWALQRVAAPADFEPVDPNQVFSALGFEPATMVEGAGELIASATLRPEDEILAYYAHVRIVQFCVRTHSVNPEFVRILETPMRQNFQELGLELDEAEFSAAREGAARLTNEQRTMLGGNYVSRSHAAEWLAGHRQRYWRDEPANANGPTRIGPY